MPVYEYVCQSCHYGFERLQPMTADSVSACPECGAASTRALSLFAAPAKVGAGVVSTGGGCACGGNCACGS